MSRYIMPLCPLLTGRGLKVKTQEELELESTIRVATSLLKDGLIAAYGNTDLLRVRHDHWEGILLTAEERLYNIRNGDRPCQLFTAE